MESVAMADLPSSRPKAAQSLASPDGRAGKDWKEGKECKPGEGGGCITELFGLLSQSHMMEILGVLIWQVKGPVRFVQLQDSLKMSPNTLSARLKSLVEAGLVTRTPFNTIPPRVDYEATAKAHDLKRVFKALHEWASENTLTPDLAPAP